MKILEASMKETRILFKMATKICNNEMLTNQTNLKKFYSQMKNQTVLFVSRKVYKFEKTWKYLKYFYL